MSEYAAPLEDMRFALEEAAGLAELAGLSGGESLEPEVVGQILEEAGRLSGEVLAPLNQPGDETGALFENGVVRVPPGFCEAYARLVDGGWISLPLDPDYGGQGLPWSVAMAVQETWHGANLAFGVCPLLTQGAVELLQIHGTPAQKETYLPKMCAGTWAGTMNLTEPQAGSDLGAITCRARRDGEHYRLTGQKIFITYGEHDMAENIVHMVLARSPDGPAGTKGLSLFIVPKFLVDADGRPGPRNDLRCVSIENKMGLHASPTCVMSYGDGEGAVGYLLGEENQGLPCLFTMMNNARLAVGVQGLGVAERAYQRARAYARERVQGRPVGAREGAAVPIIRHPDVRRMLLTMKALVEAARALAYYTAGQLDRAKRLPEGEERARHQARLDLLTPVMKAWLTDVGCEVASLGVQVHGGMGFIETAGAAQHFRDVRITPIYEGTNGIQALDLVGRKLGRDQGAAARALIAEIEASESELRATGEADLAAIGEALGEARYALAAATHRIIETLATDPAKAAAVATPYQTLMGGVLGGWLTARAALAARRRADGDRDPAFLDAKVKTARFYAHNLLPRAAAEAAIVMAGAGSTLALDEEQF